jgi:hypothetical protein
MSQPLLDATTTICRLTVIGHLPLCGLPRVSLPEASLACNVPPLPKGADEWAQSPLAIERADSAISLCLSGLGRLIDS